MKIKIKKNTLILILAAILVVVVIVILALVGVFEKEDKIPVTEKEEVAQEVSEIVDRGDFEACENIEDEEYRVICKNNIAFNLAYENLDPEWCLKLDDERMSREGCVQRIILQEALSKDDEKICQKLTNFEYSNLIEICVTEFWLEKAAREMDDSLCDNLTEEGVEYCKFTVLANSFFSDPGSFSCEEVMNSLGTSKKNCELYKQRKLENKVFNCSLLDNFVLSEICAKYQDF